MDVWAGEETDSMSYISKLFPFDLAEEETAIASHKLYNGVELLIYKASFVADYCYCDNRAGLVVLMVNLRNRNIESAFKSADEALDDTPLLLQRGYPLHR